MHRTLEAGGTARNLRGTPENTAAGEARLLPLTTATLDTQHKEESICIDGAFSILAGGEARSRLFWQAMPLA